MQLMVKWCVELELGLNRVFDFWFCIGFIRQVTVEWRVELMLDLHGELDPWFDI